MMIIMTQSRRKLEALVSCWKGCQCDIQLPTLVCKPDMKKTVFIGAGQELLANEKEERKLSPVDSF